MTRFWPVLTTILTALLLAACGGAQSPATPSTGTPPAPTVIAAATSTPAGSSRALAGTTPAPTGTTAPTGGVAKLDVNVGSPPAVGWKWLVMQRSTGPTDVAEDTRNHGNFWVFYVLKGSTEVGIGGDRKTLGVGEATLIPVQQDHLHRHPAQSEILGFHVRPSDRPPGDSHGGKLLFTSEQPIEVSAGNYSVQVREFTLARGGRATVNVGAGPFAYVIEGTLSTRSGNSLSTTDAGKVLGLPSSGTIAVSNDGATAVQFVLVDLHR